MKGLITAFSFIFLLSFTSCADVLIAISNIPVKAVSNLVDKKQDNLAKIDKKDFSLPIGKDSFIEFLWIAKLKIWASKYEITNKQYLLFNSFHNVPTYYSRRLDLPNQPVVYVSWDDANSFCNWLNKNYLFNLPAGYMFRLPTEEEWVELASCGKNKIFPWGNTWPPPNSWNYKGEEGAGFFYDFFEKEPYIVGHNDSFIVSAPVEKSGVNEWGLYGIGGNVWEWCLNWFDNTKVTKALRGASWYNWEKEILAITNRSDALPTKNNAMIGFRVVIAPPPLIDY